jgi:DeoR/GlpR family transcriptional regulator of sugar metabolism
MDTNDNLLKAERHNQIRKLVNKQGRVTVQELSAQFGVSEATTRRDLEELHGLGQLRRTHGGAVQAEKTSKEPPMMQRIGEKPDEKERIGKAAADLIQDSETIFLGSGTTVIEIARNLPADINLTVITNSLPVVNELANHPGIELIIIGGMLRQSELSMVGHVAEQAVREFRADRIFLGMHAIDPKSGFTSDFLPEIMTDRAIMSIGRQVVILADHSKFDRISSVLVAPVTSANVIVTDMDTSSDCVDQLTELGVHVMVV